MEVYVDDEAKLTLHGLQQHYVKLKENEKNKKLFELLDVLEFNQVCPQKSIKLYCSNLSSKFLSYILNYYNFYFYILNYSIGCYLCKICTKVHGLGTTFNRTKFSCNWYT